jgi:phosphate starvation-inducible protein PhoH
VDRATRHALEMRRDTLAAALRSLDHDRKERIRQLRLSPGYDQSSHTRDPRVAELTDQQNLLIRRIDEIDARLGVR